MAFRRTILKQELVKKLYPDSASIKSAMQNLRRDIELCPELKDRIADAGQTRRHYYNLHQLNIILEHFCISHEEFEKKWIESDSPEHLKDLLLLSPRMR